MRATSLAARARRDGFDLDALYPTERRAAGWIDRGEDPPVAARRSLWQRRRATAWLATQALLFSIGGVALVAAMATLPAWIIVAGAAVLIVAWFALFHMIKQIEKRKEQSQ